MLTHSGELIDSWFYLHPRFSVLNNHVGKSNRDSYNKYMYGYVTDYFYAQVSFLIALHFRAFLIVQRQKINKIY